MTGELTNHLWQSTLFAVLAGLLAFAFRKNRAEVRYWLWLAGSLKFLVPFFLLVSLGSHLGWAPAASAIPTQAISVTILQIAQPFADPLPPLHPGPRGPDWMLMAIFAVWVCGFAFIALIRLKLWLRIQAAVRSSTPLEIPAAVEVRSSPGLLEPGVVGLFRPVLLLPEGIIERLTPLQMAAVLAHELCHVRRRDNLTAAIHMMVEAVFWFHPLVWWIGVELVKERERACDEEVLQLGSEPQVYAEGIVSVCKFYSESPLRCVPGVAGSNLRKRVELIMEGHVGNPLSGSGKLLLATTGMLTLVVPMVVGVVNASPRRGESQAENMATTTPLYEVLSIIPDKSGINWQTIKGGPDGFTATNEPLRSIIREAYQVEDNQISGASTWVNSERYDIEAKIERSAADKLRRLSPEQRNPDLDRMLQALLADQFKLTAHRETKEVLAYDLVIAENGPKLQASISRDNGNPRLRVIQDSRGQITGQEVPVATLARLLSDDIGSTVLDKTGLKGHYDVALQWSKAENNGPRTEDRTSPETSGPSIFTAIQEQLGLKLKPANGPVEFLVIDHVERPSIPEVIESLFQKSASSAHWFAVSSEPSNDRISLKRAKEAMLKQELWTLRTFISKYTLSKQKAPQGLNDLVLAGYIKQIPADPMTLRPDWRVEWEPATMMPPREELIGIDDVHSSSIQTGSDGTAYSTW